jgi:hypothetical protein
MAAASQFKPDVVRSLLGLQEIPSSCRERAPSGVFTRSSLRTIRPSS